MTSVSVVVPTRDRPADVARLLDALDSQAADEVIVVADGGSQGAALSAVLADRPHVVLLRLDGIGPAAARNAGVRAASGEIVLFIDDDCRPEPGWAATLAAAVERGDGDVVGGRTEPPGDAGACVLASERIVAYVQDKSGLLTTNNVACRRELAVAHPFDERFRAAAGEDREWCFRLRRSGFRLTREPNAVLTHVPEGGLGAFWRRNVRYGRGSWHLRRSGLRRPQPGFYVGLVRNGFRHGALSGGLVLLAQAATAWGLVVSSLRRR